MLQEVSSMHEAKAICEQPDICFAWFQGSSACQGFLGLPMSRTIRTRKTVQVEMNTLHIACEYAELCQNSEYRVHVLLLDVCLFLMLEELIRDAEMWWIPMDRSSCRECDCFAIVRSQLVRFGSFFRPNNIFSSLIRSVLGRGQMYRIRSHVSIDVLF